MYRTVANQYCTKLRSKPATGTEYSSTACTNYLTQTVTLVREAASSHNGHYKTRVTIEQTTETVLMLGSGPQL